MSALSDSRYTDTWESRREWFGVYLAACGTDMRLEDNGRVGYDRMGADFGQIQPGAGNAA